MAAWIKVNESLPNDKEYVLICYAGGIELAYCDRTRGTWWSDWSDYPLNEVTHWMPLPEQPED